MATRIREICLDANNQPIPAVMETINRRLKAALWSHRLGCSHCQGTLVFRFTSRKGGRSGDPIIQCLSHMLRVPHPKSTITEAHDPRYRSIFQPEFDLFDAPKPKRKRKRKRHNLVIVPHL
jgi:hypothetical protein